MKKTRKAKPFKAELVKAERGFSPDEVVMYGELIDEEINKNHPGQTLEHYWFEDYVWTVAVRVSDGRLMTAYRNGKKKKEMGR